MPDEAIRLWPGNPPDALPGAVFDGEQVVRHGAVTGVVAPRLHVYRPATPNGAAALVIAGGGYERVELAHESGPVCRWLASRGVIAFELVYRLPEQGWVRTAPLQDGQRAMRVIRSRAQRDGFDPNRIAILGFSAGGHLAGMTAFDPNARRYPEADGIDRLSARPNLAALLYPVLTLLPPFDRTRSHRHLLGDTPLPGTAESLSPVLRIDANAPRTFLAQAVDDPVVPVDNVLLAHTALRNARVPAALHVYQTGGHGWALGTPDSEPASWPGLFERWARSHRWFG